MKQILFFGLMLLACGLSAQEVVSETREYVPYQDTLFILKTTTITNQGIEGINDTLVDYAPPPLDTAGLINLLYTQAQNTSNEKSAKFRRAFDYKIINNEDSAFEALLDQLGVSLDSMRVVTYGSQFKGRYRFVDAQGGVRFFDLIDHPTLPTRLRMDEDGGANENLNVTIDGPWRMTIRLNNVSEPFEWSGEDRDRPAFYKPIFWLPGQGDNTRFVRIQ